ncbi:MAG: hypothetical protein ACFUZC_14865 [Chthoniobacteraceae bacterium]
MRHNPAAESAAAFFRKGQHKDLVALAKSGASCFTGVREKYIARHLRDLRPADAERARELIIAELKRRISGR